MINLFKLMIVVKLFVVKMFVIKVNILYGVKCRISVMICIMILYRLLIRFEKNVVFFGVFFFIFR